MFLASLCRTHIGMGTARQALYEDRKSNLSGPIEIDLERFDSLGADSKHKRRCRSRQSTDAARGYSPCSSEVHGPLDWIEALQVPCRAVLGEGKTAMADYRCYLVNNLDQIQSATHLQCAEDSEAMVEAGVLARAQSLTVEIWNGARLVGRVPQAGTSR